MNTREAKILGSRGGKTTLKKHGPEHYRKLSEKRWAAYRKQKAKEKK